MCIVGRSVQVSLYYDLCITVYSTEHRILFSFKYIYPQHTSLHATHRQAHFLNFLTYLLVKTAYIASKTHRNTPTTSSTPAQHPASGATRPTPSAVDRDNGRSHLNGLNNIIILYIYIIIITIILE